MPTSVPFPVGEGDRNGGPATASIRTIPHPPCCPPPVGRGDHMCPLHARLPHGGRLAMGLWSPLLGAGYVVSDIRRGRSQRVCPGACAALAVYPAPLSPLGRKPPPVGAARSVGGQACSPPPHGRGGNKGGWGMDRSRRRCRPLPFAPFPTGRGRRGRKGDGDFRRFFHTGRAQDLPGEHGVLLGVCCGK